MGEVPAAPAAPEAPAAPAAPGAPQVERERGVYDLTTLPPLQDNPNGLITAENRITGYGFNWNGLSDRVKYLLHNHAIPRSIDNRGVSRRRTQLRGVDGDNTYRVTHYFTVDSRETSAMYLIQRENWEDEEVAHEPVAMNLVIQPGNEHWLLTTNNAIRMTTANVANAVQNLNESIDIKKYILRETIYQQNKETMKISELQALVKEAIQEVLSENQPERSPETPDRDTETLPDPGTKPGRTTRRRKVGNPDVDPKPKAYLEEAEKEIMKMITQRFKAEKNA